MKISENGLNLIKSFEGLRLKAYKDSVGIWTIGYGHTKNVKFTDIITNAEATAFLLDDLQGFERIINSLVQVPITQNQYDAMVSLTFNIGGGNFKKSSVLRYVNQGEFTKAANSFLLFNKARIKGVLTVLQGLANRRAKERQLFLK